MNSLLAIGDADFRWVTDLVYERFGIRMGEQKRPLVEARLQKRIRSMGLGGFSEYFSLLRADGSGAELSVLMNLLTTNHSYFWRESGHFSFLASEVLEGIRSSAGPGRPRELRIWSAGCAAGEEVYSIAMLVRDSLLPVLASVDIGILATDISAQALEEARKGVYPETRLRELPKRYREACFESAGAGTWAVKPEIRNMILFKRLNLMREGFPFHGLFDVVFCRNVMIYFDAESRARLVKALHAVTKPGGYLFIGHSESLQRDESPYDYIRPAIYRKAG